MTLPAGTRLGVYELLAPLGAGGMGEVYRARDTRLAREVAVKVLPADLSSDADRLTRFEREARSASALNHPNIVTVHEIGTTDGISYIAMELVDGKTLRELLVSGAISTRKLLPIASQVADGLSKAHESGIVHRDLKPENVMVNRDGFVKLLDFGLAKLTAPSDDGGSQLQTLAGSGTRPGMVMGTVGYMSPEQASGEAVDFRSDQFSFGSILYEMATGKRAFQKKTPVETLSAILREDPEPIVRANPEAPAPLRWIVERCLAKEPENRYAATRDLARDLKQAQQHISETSMETPAVARPKRPWPLWAAALTILAAVVVAGVLMRMRGVSVPAAPATLRRLTFGPGLEDEPSFSPDGKFMAYTTDERGNLDVVVLPLAGGEPIRIAATDADEAQPAWSPDGSRIAFVSAQDHGGRLGIALGVSALEPYVNAKLGDIFLVPALGGTPVKLVEDAYYPAWSPDGKRIAYMARRQGRSDLWNVAVDGGAPAAITQDEDFDYQPAYSPDGRWIAYGSGPLAGPHNLRVVPSYGGKPSTLTSGFAYVTRPSWAADSRAIYYAGERDGISNVWRVAFSDGRPGALSRVTVGQGQDANVAVSREGKQLVFASVRNEFNIWELTVATGQLRAVTSGSGNADYPQLSPDGKTLLVTSNRTGRRGVWRVDLNGRFLSQLIPGQTLEPGARWSPDGRQIAYLADPDELRIQEIGRVDSRMVLRVPNPNFVEWSPDGKEIAATGRQIVVYDVSSGKARTIALPGEQSNPTWSPDGKWIGFYQNRDPIRELFIVPAEGGEPTQLTRDQEDSHPAWSPTNSDEILFLRDHKRLAVISVSTRQVRFLPGYAEGSYILDYPSWSRDGKKIYFSVSRKSGDIYQLEGF